VVEDKQAAVEEHLWLSRSQGSCIQQADSIISNICCFFPPTLSLLKIHIYWQRRGAWVRPRFVLILKRAAWDPTAFGIKNSTTCLEKSLFVFFKKKKHCEGTGPLVNTGSLPGSAADLCVQPLCSFFPYHIRTLCIFITPDTVV